MTILILIILPHNPGDVVMALQAIRRLKAVFPGLEVDYLVGEECRDLVQGSPLLRKVRVIPKKALKESWQAGDGSEILHCLDSFLSSLAATQYHLSANFFQENFGGIIQSFVQAKVKIGLELVANRNFQVKSRFMEHLFAIPADRGGNGWHVVDIYVRAVSRALESVSSLANQECISSAGIHRLAENAVVVLPPTIRPEVCKMLRPGEYLAFHPGSAWLGKRWPETHWRELALLCAQAGFTIAFTGAPEEKTMMLRILSGLDPALRGAILDCVGNTSLLGAAWIHGHARMSVTGDTVAMHLAAASGVPTLCLFGASNPVETGPYGRGHIVVQTNINLGPHLAFAQEHTGLAHLTPSEVAGYLLEGVAPPGFAMWETRWDQTLQMQSLRGYQGILHPHQTRATRLQNDLDHYADRGTIESSVPDRSCSPAQEELYQSLLTSISEATVQNLARLQLAEKALAEATDASLIWEAYRIAINGLPIVDMRTYLSMRLTRFLSAIREEAFSSVA